MLLVVPAPRHSQAALLRPHILCGSWHMVSMATEKGTLLTLKNAHFSGARAKGAERPERGLPMEFGHPS